ncbi:hypothetical protein HW132_06780 [Brasilonema sp. CT11]|nr:hypothetical protein [Brasilonema sp. CT11]
MTVSTGEFGFNETGAIAEHNLFMKLSLIQFVYEVKFNLFMKLSSIQLLYEVKLNSTQQ